MNSEETNIRGYRVELEFEGEGADVVSQCFITKGNYSASLAALVGTGCLTDLDDEIQVPANVIREIEAWAMENGY